LLGKSIAENAISEDGGCPAKKFKGQLERAKFSSIYINSSDSNSNSRNFNLSDFIQKMI